MPTLARFHGGLLWITARRGKHKLDHTHVLRHLLARTAAVLLVALSLILMAALLVLMAASPILVAVCAASSAGLPGGGDTASVQITGYTQLWWALEQVENGRRHPGTLEDAADEASGFSFRRARLAANYQVRGISGCISLKLEGSPIQLLDAYAVLPVQGDRLALWAGQMKVPSTYEVAEASDRLDFATRSRFSREVADFSLCKNISDFAPRFRGVSTGMRDLGVGLRASWPRTACFLMVGNGLGANRYIGGGERKQEIYANSFGAYMYAVRVSGALPAIPGLCLSLCPGGHFSWNNHPNIILDDERTVTDIRRRSWSCDLRSAIADRLHLTVMYGEASVEDDNDYNGRDDYRMRGWEAKAVAQIVPGLLDAGLRYDVFAEEWHENGNEDLNAAYTAGLTCTLVSGVRLQAEYKHKRLDSDANPDIADDLFVLALQIGF